MEATNSITISDESIILKIYLIRNQKVMLDNDLAKLYGVGTRDLNKAVKRNLKRFPDDFRFLLTSEEMSNLMCQNGTSSWGGNRKPPYAFTEQGIAMLSSVLHLEQNDTDQEKKIMLILDYLKSLEIKEQQEKLMKDRNRIGFKIPER